MEREALYKKPADRIMLPNSKRIANLFRMVVMGGVPVKLEKGEA